jgi:hypothetical protein
MEGKTAAGDLIPRLFVLRALRDDGFRGKIIFITVVLLILMIWKIS